VAILNYTTTISAEKTASEIQQKLAKARAQAVLCEYGDDGVMCAMSFRIATANGPVFFRLPANTDGVLRALTRDKKVPQRLKTRQQAANVAWRVLKDWIEAQLAIVEAEMADVMEVFLPYAVRLDGATVYQAISHSGMKGLTHEDKPNER
jgi:hypothetical protein